MRAKCVSYSGCAVLLAVTWMSAQVPSAEVPACNPKTAQLMVEQQVTQSKSVTARPKRIKILLASADFLWLLDQPTARAYFIEAFATAKDHFAEKGFEKTTSRSGSGTASVAAILPDLRLDVIRAASKRDADLAKKFTEDLLAEYEKTAKDRTDQFDQTREQRDLLRLASETAKTNPELSRYLFRRVMRYPLIQEWAWALSNASRADQAFADAIYAEALQSYRNETPQRMLHLSAYPFGSTATFGQGRTTYTIAVGPEFVPDPALQRLFLETYFARIASFASNPEEMNRPPQPNSLPEAVLMVIALRELEPIIVGRLPDMLQRFSVARSQANALLTAEMRKDIDGLERSSAEGALSFEERIKRLEEADSKGTLTDSMIGTMIFPGRLRTDEHFKLLEPWLGKIKDEKLRGHVTSYFWFLRAQLAIKEDRLADAEKMAAKVVEIDHRALVLFEISKKQLDSANDAGSAFDTLNNVSKLTRTAPNSVAKVQILLSLSQMYERVSHSLALDELSEAVRVINQLEDPEIFQNWLTRQIIGKDFAVMATIALPGSNFDGLFAELGSKDFEMAVANARSLNDRYFRTIGVIAVASNCVRPRPASPTK
ncbi:MAG: hypothetical protein AB7J13_11760 [Pyrinomonadaceae bacterium]